MLSHYSTKKKEWESERQGMEFNHIGQIHHKPNLIDAKSLL